MIQQVEITLTPKFRGFHLVTSEIMRQLPKLPKTGIIRSNLFACQSKNVGGYIGESTRCEIAYAEKSGKKINYLENKE